MPTSLSRRLRLTPSETTRSASTSRPESVSSRIAILGLSSRICRISWRFFSPPEKPSLTLRSANAESISRADISVRTSLTQVRSFGAWPETAVAAVRRKFDTETPGTSTGYCMARKRPARARASTVIASTSWPSSVTDPEVTVYFGWPAIEYASVDLPEPLGPMIAWVSPSRIVSVTPLRISLPSSSVLTETCRSLISRMLMLVGSPRSCVRRSEAGEARNFVGYSLRGDSVQGGGDVDVHIGSAYLDREGRHGFGGGKAGRLAGAEVEPRAVEPALDRAALDLALAQRDRGVGADVFDREDLVAVASDRDLLVADLDGQRLGVAELVERAGQLVAHD